MRQIMLPITIIFIVTQAMAAPKVKIKKPIDPILLEQASTACTFDVLSLCSEYIFDHDKIPACLRQKTAQLSPDCLRSLRAIH
jgi:hypothetical protein